MAGAARDVVGVQGQAQPLRGLINEFLVHVLDKPATAGEPAARVQLGGAGALGYAVQADEFGQR
ncbi:MAG: hypothetical protein ABI563_11670 [Specibacter sp.]